MNTIMEDCQSRALDISNEQYQTAGLISGIEIQTVYRATVNCPILEYRGQEPQTGEAKRTAREAVSNLGETMGIIACNSCPISRMDLRQGEEYLAKAAIEKAAITELIANGALPENWHP